MGLLLSTIYDHLCLTKVCLAVAWRVAERHENFFVALMASSHIILDDDVTGVRVTKIGLKSLAQGKLHKGDIIMEVAQEQVDDTADFIAKMKSAEENEDAILLLINRSGGPVFYSLEPEA